jgi:hypothetical protein
LSSSGICREALRSIGVVGPDRTRTSRGYAARGHRGADRMGRDRDDGEGGEQRAETFRLTRRGSAWSGLRPTCGIFGDAGSPAAASRWA